MYDDLVRRLRSVCEDCKLWDGNKCCLDGRCTSQIRAEAADAIESLERALKGEDEIITELQIKIEELLLSELPKEET